MQCRCGHENRPGAKFCEECAAPLRVRARAAASELRPDREVLRRVRRRDGRDRGRSEPRASGPAGTSGRRGGARKVVTIVFADLVGSTALHERLDPESARRFMERYYAAMRGAVESHGGTVTQLLGDGVKAVFGIPRVAEDDAIRAVRAAVAMQRGLPRAGGAAARRGRQDRSARRGEHRRGGGERRERDHRRSGERRGAPAGAGPRRRRRDRRVDAAARLDARHARAARQLRAEGPHRGGDGIPCRVARAPGRRGDGAFVGRDDELARIAAVYETAVEKPATSLAVLLGSPGLGKSRLIDEFARRLGDAATVVRAHCDAAGGATFAPIAEALRELLGIEDGASAEALRAAIEPRCPATTPSARASSVASPRCSPDRRLRRRRRSSWCAACSPRSRDRPVVLVIDDVHWAEPLLLDLVEHLVQWGSGVPLLVLVGARPELREMRSSLATPGGLVSDVVTLAGLDAGAAMRLAANVIGAADLPAAVAAKVLATSEGNPLFVGELVRMLVQEGALKRDGDRWTAGAELAALEMPPTIHALLAARIERLRPEERTVLERAAVVGRQFSRSAVDALLPRDVGDLDARLEVAAPQRADRARHRLVPRRACAALPSRADPRRGLPAPAQGNARRAARALADWIEARVGDSIEHDETIGWHLEQAHQHLRELGPIDATAARSASAPRAISRPRPAGARTRRPAARGGPARPRARSARRRRSRARRSRARLVRGAARGGRRRAGRAAIDELGRFTADSERLRAWHTCFAGQLTVLTAPQALHATADAVAAAAEALTSLGDAAGEAKAHFVHALALARLGKVGACEAALDRALAAARRAGDRRRANTVLASRRSPRSGDRAR